MEEELLRLEYLEQKFHILIFQEVELDVSILHLYIKFLNSPYKPPNIGPNKARGICEYEGFSSNFIEKIFKSMGEI